MGYVSFSAAFITAYLETVSLIAVVILSHELANVVYVRLRARWGDVVRFMDGAYVVYTRDQHHVDAPRTLNVYMDIRNIPRTLKSAR